MFRRSPYRLPRDVAERRSGGARLREFPHTRHYNACVERTSGELKVEIGLRRGGGRRFDATVQCRDS